jgi:CelD/BcsL family acetyltransferase involved in cellulose biosynthesis
MEIKYNIEIFDRFDVTTSEPIWKYLEELAKPTFFLSWQWISTWIQTYNPDICVVLACFNQRPVAIGIFSKSTETRRLLIHSNQLRLNQTGNARQDQICIEYNDLLCDPLHKKAATIACLETLMLRISPWDEVVIANMPLASAQHIHHYFKSSRTDYLINCFSINLTNIKSNTVLDSLSKNSRYQIRRSIRLFEELYGSIRLETAKSSEEAIEWFHTAGGYHRERWDDSGYDNPDFISFHENLIRCHKNEKVIRVLKITSGKMPLAYMYYFLYNKSVHFYLQGIQYFDNGKLKPGLVAHVFAIDYFLEQGFDQYDFMGGDSQYKMQLCDATEQLQTVIVHKGSIPIRLENTARHFKQWVSR